MLEKRGILEPGVTPDPSTGDRTSNQLPPSELQKKILSRPLPKLVEKVARSLSDAESRKSVDSRNSES